MEKSKEEVDRRGVEPDPEADDDADATEDTEEVLDRLDSDDPRGERVAGGGGANDSWTS
jgi:hypothetical protein